MPSNSKSQYKFMEICSYNKEFADARKIDQEVAREWHEEDKKKRKEDPEWYKNLPEKSEKTDDKGKGSKKQKKSKTSKASTESRYRTFDW